MSLLVIDIGTSGVRAAVVRPDAAVTAVNYREVLPDTPAPGLVEFDAAVLANAALDVARKSLAEGGPVEAVGIANQRASTIVWDRATGEPVGPALGWQDLRTVGTCLVMQAEGLHFAPNESATKLAHLLDEHDPQRERDLCFGTVDTWIVWKLTNGAVHVTDSTNAGVTGLVHGDGSGWNPKVLEALKVPEAMLPRIAASTGAVGEATALEGAPPIAGIAGDQQASLVGQGCVVPGLAKITFGTGGMLDMCVGDERPRFERRGGGGCFPIVAWRRGDTLTWGVEAVMLAAGANVEWLRDDLGLISSAAESDEVAASCADTGGVFYVPAPLGMGTPTWDFGARSVLVGLTRGTGRAEVVRAVLEGVAHRGADLVEAAETDAKRSIDSVRVDGGMTANQTFVQALANAIQRPVEVSPVLEATTLGAAYLAGMAVGTWKDESDIASSWSPKQEVEPDQPSVRERWLEARHRALRWEPDLSALDF